MSVMTSPIDRLAGLGGSVWLDGERLRCRIPSGNAEAREAPADIRQDREAIMAMLRDRESKAPTVAEVGSMLPSGIVLVSYQPKRVPFVVTPGNLVTNAGKFFRAYLADLSRRAVRPDTHSCAPLSEILAKLSDAGLELAMRGLA